MKSVLNPRMPSNMVHDFSKVAQLKGPRSAFKSFPRHVTTLNAGFLVPIFCEEVNPGDTLSVKAKYLARLNTPLFPVMDNIYMETHWFYSPCYQLWDNAKKFFGEKVNPDDSTEYETPQMPAPVGGWTVGSLGNYFGMRLGVTKDMIAYPFRMYNDVYNYFYRAQKIIDSVVVDRGDGPDDPVDYTLRRRGKRFDYFTSLLPEPQEGDPVTLPLGGGEAPVKGIGKYDQAFTEANDPVYETGASAPRVYADASAPTYFRMEEDPNNVGYPYVRIDLGNLPGMTVSQWRLGMQMQAFQELMMHGGNRYEEIIYAQWDVMNPGVGYRPEFLGGSKEPVYIIGVPQTAPTSGTNALGQLAATGTGFMENDGFTKTFLDWGWVMCIISVFCDLTYSQGIQRKFTRRTVHDYFWPIFQSIGDQPVLTEELYVQSEPANAAANAVVLGYGERGSELMYFNSLVTGQMAPDAPNSLEAWHFSQEFISAPELSQAFIEENPPIERIVAVPTDQPHFKLDCSFEVTRVARMSRQSVPGNLMRF